MFQHTLLSAYGQDLGRGTFGTALSVYDATATHFDKLHARPNPTATATATATASATASDVPRARIHGGCGVAVPINLDEKGSMAAKAAAHAPWFDVCGGDDLATGLRHHPFTAEWMPQVGGGALNAWATGARLMIWEGYSHRASHETIFCHFQRSFLGEAPITALTMQ